ncbi:uncharacterized protein Z519_00306 [Cladophialophora bantiana CBS 173.52]|uniref:Uncharacterized protein n=1 Tax=Cladophialophora bantiana (strain ATCC 10958 / CBS 173.52 / CDC B-1940 / NIH 8579) TaxID=1442370 RepID=A0A0D2I5V6_CLAB1|nr:uncharacterized protein Z519_00306 [Cladophialophora bantiana CBS 173.52]KIW98645.1 hypothetical protein Z519_00306 [Cladophialophora bantiana CBS 173.52]
MDSSACAENAANDSSFEPYPPSFSIRLSQSGDSEANFRTEDDPEDPDQRSNVIQRRGIFYADCFCTDIVHGYYSADPNSNDLASVIVLKFRFEPLEQNHRIKKVDIQVTFSPKNNEDREPWIDRMHPEGFFSVQPTTQRETVNTLAGGKVGANATGVEVGAELKREKTVERDTSDATTVQGFILTEGRNYGKPNSVSWILRENKSTKSGVPTSLQAAILLKRIDLSKFQAHFTLKIYPNWLATALSFMKSNPRDDPVTFDPRRKPTNRLQVYNTDDLGNPEKLKLEDLSDVTVTTIVNDAVKQKKPENK